MKKLFVSLGLLFSSVTTFYLIFDGFKGNLILLGEGLLSRFSYYTIQTNLLVAIWLVMLLISRFSSPKVNQYLLCPLIGQAKTIYITITAIVYWAVLVPIFGTYFTFGNLWQHGIIAILAWFFYLIIIPKPLKVDRKKGQLMLLLIYPLGYMT